MNHPSDSWTTTAILRCLTVLCCGALCGVGLSVSGMIYPENVLSFLHGRDMGLTLVMGGAIMVTLLAYQLMPSLSSRPLLGGTFDVHVSAYTRRTALGAALFGTGWGLCGVCPGPAIAGLGAGNGAMLLALTGIAVGAYLQGISSDSSAH